MALQVDTGLVLSALLVIVIVSLQIYIFFHHHPKHFTNIPLEAVGTGDAQDTHVVNQDELDLNPSTESTSTSETLRPPTSSLVEQSEAATGEVQDNHVVNQDQLDLNLLEKLETTMLSINNMVDYAEEKATTDPSIKPLLNKLKDAFYDAEDLLDVIATQNHEVSSTSTPWNPFGRSLQKELEDVFGRMQFISAEIRNFGLLPSTRSNSTPETFRPPTTSLVEKSCVYGRDDDKDEIKRLLLSTDDRTNGDVIAIVGMGGLGKTTLAQLVFDDYEINRVFKSNKVWICVAEDFDVIKITKTILYKLTEKSYDTCDLDLLHTKLKETLCGKKFLFVLDDVWKENDTNWNELRKPFSSGAPGSKIIVTTRTEKVASVMRATSTYKLDPLSDEACWKLFSKHAFDENTQSNVYSKFEATFEANVVKKCGGLPLAAKVLGGLLRGKGCKEWDEILRSNIWDEKGEVLPVLRLSYYYLPSNLKRCFAFCSIVPKDFDFEREKLVLLWMAENLLQDSMGNKKRIDVGYEYLRELESRSLIQPGSHVEYLTDKKSYEELYFSMHDLVNDLAKSVSGEFYKSFDLGNSFNVGEKTRHFSYEVTSDDYEDPTRFKWFNIEVDRLRTLLLIYEWHHDVTPPPLLHVEIWLQLKVLRSLTLASACITNLPDSIGNLKLLRYLDISNNKELEQLPESLTSLYNLEVLILSHCFSLKKLPSRMAQLVKLNYLNIRDTRLEEMPLEMGRLKNLDVLTDFVLGKSSGSSIGELNGLKDLRDDLHIRGLQNITNPEEALVANLKGKSNLEKLWLDWNLASQWLEMLRPEWDDIDSDNNLEDATIILENLKPHVNLKQLYIGNYPGTRLPDWSGQYSFANLASIEIVYFKRCIDLSPLGQLPSLKTLSICNSQSVRTLVPTEILAGHFSALVDLAIYECPELELPQHHCFTSIEILSLRRGSCASLQFFPLSSFPNLKELELEHLQSIESLEVIDEANNLNLNTLDITGCKKLIANRSSWGLQRLLSLSHLKIGNFECDDLESFPEERLLPSSLSTLKIFYVPNLRSLNGKSFQLLTSLERLELRFCPKLKCLPEEGLPISLSTFVIQNCPLLKSRCQREQGEDWSKIAHIPNIDIED